MGEERGAVIAAFPQVNLDSRRMANTKLIHKRRILNTLRRLC